MRTPVIDLVFLLEAAQDRDGVLDGGLLDQHGLEPALQGGVLFDILAVFVEGRGPDAAQGASGERRLEHVGGIHGPLGGAGAHQGVQLVDEEHHLTLGALYFFQDRLETVFEFTPVFCAGDQSPPCPAPPAGGF